MNVDQSLLGAISLVAIFIGPIAPIAAWYRNHSLQKLTESDSKRIAQSLHSSTRRMWIAWACALLFLAAWIGFDRYTDRALTPILPVHLAVLITFHVLMWPFVAPMLNRLERLLHEIESSAQTTTSIREASLQPRRLNEYMPTHWKAATAIVAFSGAIVVGIALLQAGAIETRLLVMALALAGFGGFELLIWAFVTRMEVTTTATYGGLSQAAAEELRQFRVRGFFWMLLTASIAFFAAAWGCIEVGRGTIVEPNMGIIGGVVGSFIGLGGAAFGIAASLKMNRLRQESNTVKS